MKRFLLGGAVALFGTVSAFATDIPAKAPIYKATPAYSWSGFYAGIHGGYGWGKNDIADFVILPAVVETLEPTGGFGGAQIGYNSQFAPHWLIGGEIDFSGGDLSDRRVFASGIAAASNKIDYFGTARTRFGYVQDRSLFYVTGGVAWMHDKYNLTVGGHPLTDSSQFHVGWTIGGGLEYALDPRWSVKLEYLYANFDKNTDNTGNGIVRTSDANLSTVKAGVNYRFGDVAVSPAYMPVKAVAPRSNWNGGYFGVHGGYGWADYHAVDGGFVPAEIWDLNPSGGFGGFQSGSNWQFAPNWLFGIETDASYGDLNDHGTITPAGLAITSKLQGIGTARARFGYVMDNVLLYATGGGAYGREKSTLFVGAPATSKEDHFGWTAGGGVEWKFAPDWSAKAEYLYMDLGNNRFNVGPQPRNTEITASTVKVGINYYGPLIERFFTR